MLALPSPMQHPIDPKVDCVFKALLGTEENRDLLIHFLYSAQLRSGQDYPLLRPTYSIEMRKAMNTLKLFSEKEKNYHEYQARLNYLREQRTIRWEYEQDLEQERQEKEEALREKQEALREKQEALREKQEALAEIERLKTLLARSKVDPEP